MLNAIYCARYTEQGFDDDAIWHVAQGYCLVRFYGDGSVVSRRVVRVDEREPESNWIDREDARTCSLSGSYTTEGSNLTLILAKVGDWDDDRPVNWKYWGEILPKEFPFLNAGTIRGVLEEAIIRLDSGLVFTRLPEP